MGLFYFFHLTTHLFPSTSEILSSIFFYTQCIGPTVSSEVLLRSSVSPSMYSHSHISASPILFISLVVASFIMLYHTTYVALISFPRTLVSGTEFNFRFFSACAGRGGAGGWVRSMRLACEYASQGKIHTQGM
jgi:hypothetical protein